MATQYWKHKETGENVRCDICDSPYVPKLFIVTRFLGIFKKKQQVMVCSKTCLADAVAETGVQNRMTVHPLGWARADRRDI